MGDPAAHKQNILLDLPEVLLYSILTFVAPPTERASVLCHQLGPTCTLLYSAVESGLHNVWSMILCKDYGSVDESNKVSIGSCQGQTGTRRKSKRLRCTTKSSVEACHRLLLDRTAVAHYALSEMAVSFRTPLTLARLRKIMKEYGPVIKVNYSQEISGTFLVECCRARYVEEIVIFRCVKELVEKHGADVNLACTVENKSKSSYVSGLTPLIVASARGMPKVVDYLLQAGASPHTVGTGRFRLHANAAKSISGTFAPLVWSKYMSDKESENGLPKESLRPLNQCIKLLQKALEKNQLSMTSGHGHTS
mmetsp:Transcript_2943/g.4557  ORF Transcript_2943/g.4557 Transcript_2943/m.4557 type:complete len:308 (-) Transcript_2943:309-1232(-)